MVSVHIYIIYNSNSIDEIQQKSLLLDNGTVQNVFNILSVPGMKMYVQIYLLSSFCYYILFFSADKAEAFVVLFYRIIYILRFVCVPVNGK